MKILDFVVKLIIFITLVFNLTIIIVGGIGVFAIGMGNSEGFKLLNMLFVPTLIILIHDTFTIFIVNKFGILNPKKEGKKNNHKAKGYKPTSKGK